MNMVETIIAGITIALSVAIIMKGWNRFLAWKNDGRRKFFANLRTAKRKHERQLKKELRKAGLPKDEL